MLNWKGILRALLKEALREIIRLSFSNLPEYIEIIEKLSRILSN